MYRESRGHVRDANRQFRGDRRPHNSFVRVTRSFPCALWPYFTSRRWRNKFVGFVIQQNSQNLIVDDALDEFRGAAQQFLHGENGIRLAAHFVEDQQRVGLAADAFKEARVFDGDGQTAGHQRQNALLIAREVIDLRALDVEHADRLSLHHERNHHLRPNRIDDVDVPGILADVRHANRAARRRSRARDPLSDRDHPILAGFLAVSDGEAVIKPVHRFVDQQDAEDFVVDQALHERRGFSQHFVEVQRGINFLADFDQRRENFRGNV